MASYLRPRRGKKATAISNAIVLKRGEVFFEVPDTGVGTGAGKIKMGDGVTVYADLPYFSEGGSGGSGVGADITITLASTGWSARVIDGVTHYVQSAVAAGATSSTVPVIVPIYNTDAEMDAYSNIIKVEASTNMLTFIAVAQPSVSLTVVAKFSATSTADLQVITEAIGQEITLEDYNNLTPEQQATGTYWITDGDIGGITCDTALSTASHNPIENAPVATAINQINNDLSANSNHFYFDYQNGKYGYNTDPSRGAGTFSPFKTGDYSNGWNTETTLWTNSSPTSTMDGTTVSLNDNYSNYKYLKIYYRISITDSTEYSEIIPKAVVDGAVNNVQGSRLIFAIRDSSGWYRFAYRPNSSTYNQLTITRARKLDSSDGSLNFAIPTKITGLK